jgi:hypothetical protein
MSIREFKQQNPDLYCRIEKSIATRLKPKKPQIKIVRPAFWENGKLIPVGPLGCN